MSERENLPMETDAAFDRLLQAALSSYGEPASDAELAQRVLARVAAEPQRQRASRWMPWAIAVPALAGLLIFFVFFGSRSLHQPIDHAGQARVSQPPSVSKDQSEQSSTVQPARQQQAKIARVTTRRHRERTASKVAPLPKLQVFPTPQPLTPAERALAEYAAHASQADRQALIETQKKLDEPLSIAAIQIQPLEPPEGGGN